MDFLGIIQVLELFLYPKVFSILFYPIFPRLWTACNIIGKLEVRSVKIQGLAVMVFTLVRTAG
jgi:hypothetical protein